MRSPVHTTLSRSGLLLHPRYSRPCNPAPYHSRSRSHFVSRPSPGLFALGKATPFCVHFEGIEVQCMDLSRISIP